MEKRDERENLSEQAYLTREATSETKHEFINGQIVDMAGASADHAKIAGNIFALTHTHLKSAHSTCTPFIADMKVKAQSCYFYPDIMVACEPNDDAELYRKSPILIIEILSQSTKRFDKNEKKFRYLQLPSLQEYVLVDQYSCEVEIYRQTKKWVPESFYLGQQVTFESIGLTFAVQDIYYQVQNADMRKYLSDSLKNNDTTN